MSGFPAEWLALREPADRRARDAGLIERLDQATSGKTRLSIVDLGTGTGSTLRTLAARLPGLQHWQLVDYDAALLEKAVALTRDLTDRDGQKIAVDSALRDLSQPGWEALLEGTDIVTMSALLDLVGTNFIETLARHAAKARAIVYAALTVDGRLGCTPTDPLDEAIFAAFNHHMRGNKGFGSALGPDASAIADRIFAAHGFRVETATSDWRIGAGEVALAGQLLAGWVRAVRETGHVPEVDLVRWEARRLREIADGSLESRVGHVDLLALPR